MPMTPGPAQGGGLMLVDSPPARPQSITAPAGTTAQVSFPGPNAPLLWWVDRITVKARATVGGAFSTFPASSSQGWVFVGTDVASAVKDENLADLTLVGNLDIADENAPIVVDSGQVLVVVWTNTTPGAFYTARIQYRVMARV
jgi:hypothetical protein